MRLAKLELSGFKSFADYTEFVFDEGITGIVGPNGCGKSNVVDAVKWVLGEMSAKSLRGDAMLDVIFNGSGNRKPMGMAEVSLTFANQDRKLAVDADMVKITRRLYRDATSEYLINNQMSRLKDIRELFFDTGVGVDAYSLIEQGRVSALLEANSVERREIFEEAAGISRFKQRKKETLRKLEKTDQNLSQSQLVLDEVDKQLRSVKVQAGRARNYQEYAARLKELRSAYVMQEYDGLYHKQVELNEKFDLVVDELAAARRQLDEHRTRQGELQIELEAAQESVRKTERELMAAQGEQQNATQRKQFAEQQIVQATEQRELLSARQGDLAERLANREKEVAETEAAYAAIDEQLKTHEAAVAEATAKQEAAAKAIAEMNRQVDEQKSRAIDLMRQASRLHNDINGLKIQQENLLHQKERLEQRKAQIDQQVAQLKAAAGELETRRNELAEQSSALSSQAEEVRNQQKDTNQKQAELSQQLARHREQRSGLKSRQQVLQDLQAKREGVNQTVRDVLKTRDTGNGYAYVQGMVADIFKTDLQNALVVEAALGDTVNALVIDNTPALVADGERWRKLGGRVATIAADRLPPYQGGINWDWQSLGYAAAPALDIVQYDPKNALLAYQILGKTMITETLADAVALAQCGPRGYRYVTRGGEVIDADGAMRLGDMSKQGGAITRQAELAKLEQDLLDVEAQVTELTNQISQCDQESRALDAQQQELRQQIYQTDSQRAEVSAQLQQTQSQLQRTSAEAPLITGEIESLDRQVAGALERQAEYEEKVAGVESTQKEVEKIIHELGAQVIVRQHEVSELSEAATQARIAMGQVQESRSSLSRTLAMARQAVSQTQMEIQRVAGEIETMQSRIDEAERTMAGVDTIIAECQQRAAAAEAQLAEMSQKVDTLRKEYSSAGSAIDTLQEKAGGLDGQERELSIKRNEMSLRIENLITNAQEELSINLFEAHKEYQPQETDWSAVAEEINDLKGKISRLGNVNIDAITEQTQLEDRQKFLVQQLADIAEAKKQLEELILKINEDSKIRFVETFNAVKTEFQDMFRKLFGGGKADIFLENTEDVLESGIDIVARPPGKEPQSITLLSGGEKTMTAVALVMSIFKSKPSPFCILDEVDAALDEANTGRFASIIHEFLNFSQFIVITHNKRTMSVASTLYGVTMQEQGVSKRVAVKFDQKGAPVIGGPSQPMPQPKPADKVEEPAAA